MAQDVHDRQSASPGRTGVAVRRKLPIALAGLTLVLVIVLVVPPMVNIGRYKNQITSLISTSLGRSVRLSSVKLHLLPWPGFVLSDLSVAEDPSYGAEPVLHATSVTASIRLLSLWRGRLDIGSISVDDASLNLVRSAPGRWNLDPLFRTAAQAGSAVGGIARRSPALPSLEATNSRINFKNGAEKLPFSIINTDFEFWEENPGEWRIRLRGQPARTDVSLYQEDTGMMRLEATVRRASSLREMPVQVDLEWREAQLGQLARLVTGSDLGWRGDLTGELHLVGTADAAHIDTQLRATGVHRAEFAPVEPMDFDANCSLVYHHATRALENLVCGSPLGRGRVRLTGNLPGASGSPQLSVELDHVPVVAGLDALRTLRSDVPAGLEVKGTVTGMIAYAQPAADAVPVKSVRPLVRPARRHFPKAPPAAQEPLRGALAVEDFELSASGLARPVQIPKIALEPAGQASSEALVGTLLLPAGGTGPLSINLHLMRSGYQVAMHGPATLARVRELFGIAGVTGAVGLEALAGDPVVVDLNADGPWLESEEISPATLTAGEDPGGAAFKPPAAEGEGTDHLEGTVTLRNAAWKADFLANPVEISQATLHLGGGQIRWDPVAFTYGPVKGTATLAMPPACAGPEPCPPHFQLHFTTLDAATLQTAILGVPAKGTLFSELLDRLRPSSAPAWPQLEGGVSADSLVLGPVTLDQPKIELRVQSTGTEITSLSASLLGGRVEGSGNFTRASSSQDKPDYALECEFEKLNAQAVGLLVGQRWSGGSINANGKIELSGYTDRDLAGSAKGALHFEWRRGAWSTSAASTQAINIPVALAHFDRWTVDTAIGENAITLGRNQVQQGSREHSVEGSLTFGDPPMLRFPGSADAGGPVSNPYLR